MSPEWYTILLCADYFLLAFVIAVNAVWLVQIITYSSVLRKYVRSLQYVDYKRFLDSEHMAPVSLIVPVYGDLTAILDSVQNLLSLDFPEYELILVNDGSQEGALEMLADTFRLLPFRQPYKRTLKTEPVKMIYRSAADVRLIVLDKENGGLADAMNAGVNVASYPVIVSVRAGVILDKSALNKIVYTFVSDPGCIIVGGAARVKGEAASEGTRRMGIHKAVAGLQVTLRLRDLFAGAPWFGVLGMLPGVPAAFGAFGKAAVIEAGGYSCSCVCEDMELAIKLHGFMRCKKRKYSVRFLPDPIGWIRPLERFSDLEKQRKRLHGCLIDLLLGYKERLGNPKHGWAGAFCLAYYWAFEWIAPLVITLGFLLVPLSCILGVVGLWFMLSYFIVAALFGAVVSAGALLLEENAFGKKNDLKRLQRLFFIAVAENFGWRQIDTVCKAENAIRHGKHGRRRVRRDDG